MAWNITRELPFNNRSDLSVIIIPSENIYKSERLLEYYPIMSLIQNIMSVKNAPHESYL